MDADDRGPLMQERFDLRHKFLRQIFKLRAETCLHALSGPHQFFTECGERGAPATMGFDEGSAEKIGPLFDEIPDVAVGEVCMVRRTGKFPGLSDLVQNSEHHHSRMWTALLAKPPDGFDFDFDIEHPVCQCYEIYFICEVSHRKMISYLLREISS